MCPSSLTLNWQNEAEKFTNKLKTLVIRGTATERKKQIRKANDNAKNHPQRIDAFYDNKKEQPPSARLLL